MFEVDPSTLLAIAFRAAAVYVALSLMLRLAGKRELGQMSVFDFVVVLIIANAVQNAMVGADTSLTGGLIAALTIIVVNRLVSWVDVRVGGLDRKLMGSPTLLVHNGQFVLDHMRREGITIDEVMMAIREHGIGSLQDVQSVVLEVDGTMSVIAVTQVARRRPRRRIRGRRRPG